MPAHLQADGSRQYKPCMCLLLCQRPADMPRPHRHLSHLNSSLSHVLRDVLSILAAGFIPPMVSLLLAPPGGLGKLLYASPGLLTWAGH